MISTSNKYGRRVLSNRHLVTQQDGIKVIGSGKSGWQLRVLVAIASFGSKNLEFLKKVIQRYQEMAMEVDVVVFSEAHKDLPSGVKLVVGLPSKNPWSLPFTHKAYFAENCDRYDLFVYSEDDMDVTEQHIQSFLRITPQLKQDEIAGYLRYECDSAGTKSLPDVHGASRWKVDSVSRRGVDTIAEFTNEHAGFYILTQNQLKRAVASGRFLTEPHEGRYGLPETAATDIYTRCSFRKVICISALEEFLVHHMPNRYVGKLGAQLSDIKDQVQTLIKIYEGKHPANVLCEVESKALHGRWSKNYDEQPCGELLAMLSATSKTVLSVGCGAGAVEINLIQRGMAVTALPLDSIIGAVAARRGIEMIYGNLHEGMSQLAGRKFDCVLVTNLLHLQPDARQFLEMCAHCVDEDGSLLVIGPNFNRIPNWIKRVFGVNTAGPATWAKQIKKLGLISNNIRWFDHELSMGKLGRMKVPLGSLSARSWIMQSRRKSVS